MCPADGIHSVAALCTLRVSIITDDMLTNSITVRLENMSQEKFLSPLLALFVEGVATVLSTTKDAVFVFNIQNDTDVRSNILNVTFSALLPGGVRDRFFPSEDLQEQIYLNRTLLTAVSTQRVLPFDDNICLREPCENYMRCVSVLRFDSSAPFISSSSVLFRPIHPVGGLRCRCPPGFTGDYCETEVDLCYSRPCAPHGRCRSREGGYTCLCREGYTGEPSKREGAPQGWSRGLTLWCQHNRAKDKSGGVPFWRKVQSTLGAHQSHLLFHTSHLLGKAEGGALLGHLSAPTAGAVTEVSPSLRANLLAFVSQAWTGVAV